MKFKFALILSLTVLSSFAFSASLSKTLREENITTEDVACIQYVGENECEVGDLGSEYEVECQADYNLRLVNGDIRIISNNHRITSYSILANPFAIAKGKAVTGRNQNEALEAFERCEK